MREWICVSGYEWICSECGGVGKYILVSGSSKCSETFVFKTPCSLGRKERLQRSRIEA